MSKVYIVYIYIKYNVEGLYCIFVFRYLLFVMKLNVNF